MEAVEGAELPHKDVFLKLHSQAGLGAFQHSNTTNTTFIDSSSLIPSLFLIVTSSSHFHE